MAAPILHADDTPIRVLDRSRRDRGFGNGGKQGPVWACISDQRPWAGTAPLGVEYRFSPDRRGEHPRQYLQSSSGILQAVVCPGFGDLYEPRANRSREFSEAACWPHLRCDFSDAWETAASEIAGEALDRIGGPSDIERQISGQPSELRQAARQQHSCPQADAVRRCDLPLNFHPFGIGARWVVVRGPTDGLAGKSDLARAFRYGLFRWFSFELDLEVGRIGIDNNPAEHAMRPIGIGRKNWLFAGSDEGINRAVALEAVSKTKLDPLICRTMWSSVPVFP
ncbi:MAG TPA: hypothetical protein DEO85_04545 [Maritimibacter sp.]|nr:hypothetical protein [Maritimibacter sp.]